MIDVSACGPPVEVLSNLRGGLDVPLVEFAAVMPAEGLRVDLDDARNVGFRHSVPGQGLYLSPLSWVQVVRATAHLRRAPR